MNSPHYPVHQPRGAVLVCVLVVLLIVGLISVQTIQTLLVMRRADRQRSQLVQARELLELGKIAMRQGMLPEKGQFELSVDGRRASVTFMQLETHESQSPGNKTIQTNSQTPRYRMIASCAVNEVHQVSVTWESPYE